jgi:hypothetical protein
MNILSEVENYIKYIVLGRRNAYFHKNDKTDGWWIEIPFISNGNNKLKENTLLPVLDEYLGACNQELPERWWKAQRKTVFKILIRRHFNSIKIL